MGCFLGCFGFSSKRKRRKPANKVLPGDPRHGSYEPLESSVFGNVDIAENPICSDPQLSNTIKEKSSVKIVKKVSFNLNVQTYEPLSKDESIYHLSESEEEDDRREMNGADTAKGNLFFVSDSDSTASKMSSIPSNYRYQNLADSYEDDLHEDDMACIESDLDDDEEYEDEEDEEEEEEYEDEDVGVIDMDDLRKKQSDYFNPTTQSMESAQGISWIHSDEDKSNNNMQQLPGPTNGELKSIQLKTNARDRSHFVNSVLNPVENLTQWKAVKARTAPPKHLRKENLALQQEPSVPLDQQAGSNLYPFSLAANCNQSKPLLQEVAVDASLSNWIASPNSSDYKVTKCSNISGETIPSKRSMFDSSCSQRSREDRPI